MIKFNELKKGGHVIADFDGFKKRGEIEDTDSIEKQACVNTGDQSFWFSINNLTTIPVNEEELINLKFHKHINEDETIKYMKGAFRLLISKKGDFSRMEIWYRDEQRHIMEPIPLHVLQSHFFEMTKVFLNEGAFD